MKGEGNNDAPARYGQLSDRYMAACASRQSKAEVEVRVIGHSKENLLCARACAPKKTAKAHVCGSPPTMLAHSRCCGWPPPSACRGPEDSNPGAAESEAHAAH